MHKHEPNDFTLLGRLAAHAEAAAESLRSALRTAFSAPAQGTAIQADARTLYRQLLNRLEHEFVPPMERRDLVLLAERLFALVSALTVAESTLRGTPYLTVTEGLRGIGQALWSAAKLLLTQLAELPHGARLQAQTFALLAAVEQIDACCASELGILAVSGASAGMTVARYAAISRLRAAGQAFAAAAESIAAASVNNG